MLLKSEFKNLKTYSLPAPQPENSSYAIFNLHTRGVCNDLARTRDPYYSRYYSRYTAEVRSKFTCSVQMLTFQNMYSPLDDAINTHFLLSNLSVLKTIRFL